MWPNDSSTVSLVPMRAEGYPHTLAEVKAAVSRVQLNDVYVNEGALVKLLDGSFKVAHTVTKIWEGLFQKRDADPLPRTPRGGA